MSRIPTTLLSVSRPCGQLMSYVLQQRIISLV